MVLVECILYDYKNSPMSSIAAEAPPAPRPMLLLVDSAKVGMPRPTYLGIYTILEKNSYA